jgi:hypothetical protein
MFYLLKKFLYEKDYWDGRMRDNMEIAATICRWLFFYPEL